MSRSASPARAIVGAFGIAALGVSALAMPAHSGAAAAGGAEPATFGAAPLPIGRATTTAAVAAARPRDVLPQRNPFADDPAVRAMLTQPRTLAAAPGVPSPPVSLPPAAMPSVAAPRVTATVVGARPLAIVTDADGVHLVTIGDALAGRTITAIDAAGVRLSDGSAIAIDSARGPTPASRGAGVP